MAVFRFEWPRQIELDELLSELSFAEIERAKRFRRQEDQLRFAYGRCILRRLLGNYIGQPLASIELTEGMNRKPVFTNSPGWQFNISHSGNWVLVAISTVWVGVDLEKSIQGFDFQGIVSQSFSKSEQQFVDKSLNRVNAFYTIWTRKEALVKATAKGVDEDFVRVPSLDGIHSVDSLVIGSSGDWLVNSFWVAEGYTAAVAYPGTIKGPLFYTLDSRFFRRG
ncbi:4'-phosphopantetheinyl transferase family protein [Spirosoma aerolatum]|uniref:4'-phosphopantetheinyl transferase family protein n=1 Tax=Spirosoma aerolatum TaxID=1211326 RepID=UPI0009AC4F6F|nr:4'-phosphopantetheinyl transferase superfamily protein [Spirosoma aerolatum]